MGKLYIIVEGKAKEEGARGNNPVRIADEQGYNIMLWSHWTQQLGLEPTMKGWLEFIPDKEE